MKRHLQFSSINDSNIDCFIYKKSVKNLSMKLNKDNQIIVSAPIFISDQMVDDFIKKNIDKFINVINNRLIHDPINLDEKYFYLFGQKTNFDIVKQNDKNKILINGKSILFSNNNIKEAIYKYIKKELNTYIIVQQIRFEKIMNIPPHRISIRNKDTAWGTNHIGEKKIYYSFKLGHYDKQIIDYVIVHELAHNKYPNHSKEFWNLVNKFEPEYKIKRYKLKKYIYS